MALLSLIFDRPIRASFETVVGSERVVVPLDASISEGHERQASVTQNAIEDGSNVADHVKLNPVRLTIEGLISDTPVSLLQAGLGLGISSASQLAAGAIGGVGGNIAAEAAAFGLGSLAGLLTGAPRRASDGFKFMEQLWENRQPFTMVTALKRYENMIMTQLSVPKSASIGKSLRFSMTLEQVRIVRSSLVAIPAFQVGGNASAQSQANLGKQGTKDAGAESSSKASLLLQGFQSAGVL